jgi:hypothetical protein
MNLREDGDSQQAVRAALIMGTDASGPQAIDRVGSRGLAYAAVRMLS